MLRARVHIFCKPELTNVAEALKVRMLHKIKYQFALYGDESVNGIVYDLSLVHKRSCADVPGG
jgi:hypothetical protein